MTVPDRSHLQLLPRRPYVTTRTHEVLARHGVGYDEARAELVRIFNAQSTV